MEYPLQSVGFGESASDIETLAGKVKIRKKTEVSPLTSMVSDLLRWPLR